MKATGILLEHLIYEMLSLRWISTQKWARLHLLGKAQHFSVAHNTSKGTISLVSLAFLWGKKWLCPILMEQSFYFHSFHYLFQFFPRAPQTYLFELAFLPKICCSPAHVCWWLWTVPGILIFFRQKNALELNNPEDTGVIEVLIYQLKTWADQNTACLIAWIAMGTCHFCVITQAAAFSPSS